ncbi:MAG: NADAR family protein, partial [Vagococcus sp.]
LRNCFSNLQPNDAKKLGRKIELREDWESIKFGVMREVIRCKFNQNPDLVKKLIGTGNEELIEGNTWHDNTYGNCSCEKCKNIVGKNVLGKILMEERTRFKKGRV